MTRSEWVKELRARSGLSIRKFADLCGAHFVTVTRWEQGHQDVSPIYERVLNVLARDYGLRPMPEA